MSTMAKADCSRLKGAVMRKSKLNESQIVGILKEAGRGRVPESRTSRLLQCLRDPTVQAEAALCRRACNALMQVWPEPNVKLA